MMRSILASILILIAAGVGWLTYDWYRARTAPGGFGEPFTLVDQSGQEITEAAFRGAPSAVFFGFTHCPEICPTTLFELDGWLAALGDEGKDIRAWFVTVDPERDTPEIMDAYVGNVSERIRGITGEPARVEAMVRSYGIYFKRVELDGGDYTMDHTASVLLLDRRGDFAGTIAYGENPETAIAKLKRLAAG
ncbi:MAG: SCO family protein [Hyphomicrobiales bacterium]|nr:MAG: SCO family protein [Hyphomicrobiales bacterium]